MDHVSAQNLLRACACGRDRLAWEEFVRRYGRRLEAGVRRGLRLARREGGGDEIEDLVQEVYCHLLDREGRRLLRPRGSSDAEVGCYLGRVAENLVLDRARAARTAKRAAPRTSSHAPGPLGDSRGWVSPESRLLLREERRAFLRGCRAVAGGRRSAWVARQAFLEGWSSLEISVALRGRISPANVDALLHRMSKRLLRFGFRPTRR